jgi:hypothetical protein
MDDLEEVVRGNLQNADQRILDRLRHVGEAALVVSPFEDMNFCDWHLKVSLFDVTEQIGSHRARWLEWLPAALLRGDVRAEIAPDDSARGSSQTARPR